MAEGQQLEDVKEQEGEAEVVEEQLWEPDVVAAKEGIQPSMSGWAETVEDQEEGMLGRGERVRRCPEWEQKGELEEAGRIERSQERKQEETLWNEGAPDQILFVEEEQKGPEGSAWTGGVQHGGLEAEGRMVEAEKEQDEEAEEDHQEEPNIVAVKEEIQEVMLLEDQEEEMPGGEEKVGRSPESEPKGELEEAAAGGTEGDQELEETLRNEGTPDQEQQGGQEEAAWTGGLQHGGLLDEAKMVEGQPLEAEKEQEGEVEAEEKPDMVAAKEGIQPSMPGWAETVEDQVEGMLGRGERVRRSLEWEQKGELEEAGRIEGSQEKKQGETLWNEGAPDQILFVEEEQKGAEGSAWTEGFQDGGLEAEGRMVEAEKEQDKEPEEDQQEEPNMVAVKEEIQEVMLLEDQEEEMPGGEEKVGRSPESEPKGELKEAVARGTEGDQELEETLRNEGTPDQEQQGGLEEAAWTGGLQHGGLLDEAKMVEGQPLEAEKEQEGEVEVVEDQHGEPDMAAAKEGIQPSMLGWAETVEVQEEGMLGGGERVRRSPEWEPKGELEEAGRCERSQEREQEDQILFVGEEQKGPEGSAWTEGFQHCGLEAEARMVEAEKDQNEEAKEDRQEEPNTVAVKEEIQEVMLVEDQEEEMLGGEGKVGRSPEWEPKGELEEAAAGGTEGDQEREMEEALWKEEVQQRASDQAQPETEADEDQQGEPVAKEGILQAVLGGAEAEEDQERVLEGEEQLRGSHQWESKEPVTSENQDVEPQGVAENRKGQQGELAEAEETEGDQQREPEDPVRNGAEAKEGDQEEETGEECLVESDQEEALQRLAEASGLDEGVLEATRDKSQLSEETERRLPEESVGYSASVNMPPLTGPRTFPAEATPLDTSAQKERVLLRRKSSIRRAPSLKRPKLQETNVAETQPQETVAEETPSQPQAPRRPNLRHAGFGPVHPNMMAELQTRLRKPQ
ncbi:trichohyalin-like [Elgaria multicarinata webbii]|uniref:trichohyalin-like n=1 Tax=Elgaria multicarinata webbii TaxID=159646 RepID=UPI002FCCEAC3